MYVYRYFAGRKTYVLLRHDVDPGSMEQRKVIKRRSERETGGVQE
jgi:hypothetical protein